jgi:hypothetical protein
LSHLIWIVAIAVGLGLGHTWLAERDARVLADAQVKAAEANVKTLADQITALRSDAAKQKQAVQAIVKSVKTPAQAIAAIPTLTDLPLNVRPGPDPLSVTVDATQLFQGLAQCKQDKIDAQSCSQVSAKQDEQIKQKDLEIAALRRKPRFWGRVKNFLKTSAIAIAAYEGFRIAKGHP